MWDPKDPLPIYRRQRRAYSVRLCKAGGRRQGAPETRSALGVELQPRLLPFHPRPSSLFSLPALLPAPASAHLPDPPPRSSATEGLLSRPQASSTAAPGQPGRPASPHLSPARAPSHESLPIPGRPLPPPSYHLVTAQNLEVPIVCG